jgi:hypothetical protein
MSVEASQASTPALTLTPGKFYRSKDGHAWCCVRVRRRAEPQARADCVRVADLRVEYFYSDGRYDSEGKREHSLVEEIPWRDPDLDEDLDG